jgi:CheY-like chemotaxis protein
VVEDEETLREVAAALLGDLGYQVTAVSCAEEALSLPIDATSAPLLLLSDIVLPGMRGDELAAILHERCAGLKVILTSGYAQERVLREAPAAGLAIDFLHKPFSAAELARLVRAVLDR